MVNRLIVIISLVWCPPPLNTSFIPSTVYYLVHKGIKRIDLLNTRPVSQSAHLESVPFRILRQHRIFDFPIDILSCLNIQNKIPKIKKIILPL